MVLLGMQRGIRKSTHARAFEQVSIFGGSRSFDEGCVLHGRSGIRESSPARDFVRVSILHWDRSFDGGRVGLAAERRQEGREGRLVLLNHCPPRSTRAGTQVTSHAAVPGNCVRSCPCFSAICTAADARLTISDGLRFSSRPLWVICRARTR